MKSVCGSLFSLLLGVPAGSLRARFSHFAHSSGCPGQLTSQPCLAQRTQGVTAGEERNQKAKSVEATE